MVEILLELLGRLRIPAWLAAATLAVLVLFAASLLAWTIYV